MRRIHFIAIGGAVMHNLALELSDKKNSYIVTGSDDEIFEPSYSRLKEKKLLPEKMGWFPEKIDKDLYAVIVGMHATADNPELIRAKELGLNIFSFPEYLYKSSIGKTRIVIGGSHGKTTTTAMILHVLKEKKIKTNYMVGAQIEGFENMVHISYDSRIAVFEGDEYLTSPIDPRPKFHLYKPHIAVLTGIAWDHINVFPTFENYLEQFEKFVEAIEPQGRLIYFEDDKHLKEIINNSKRRDLVNFSYKTPDYFIKNEKTYLKTKYGDIPLHVFGEHNLQNIEAARLVCLQLGIQGRDFYNSISTFKGASKRLEKIIDKSDRVAYKDFAHSPSKLKATVKAIREQYSDRKIVACMELHTFSSLKSEFLPQYKNCLKKADIAYVYFNPKVVKHKKLKEITKEEVANAFAGENLTVLTDSKELQKELSNINYKNSVLLIMSSGNFSGIDIDNFAKQLLE